MCSSLGTASQPFDGTFAPWQTGGAGAGTIAPSFVSQFSWPPATFANPDSAVSLLPSYTPTGVIPTLPPPTFTPSPTSSVNAGNGWFDKSDTVGAYTSIQGCSYPNAWAAVGVAVPATCGGGAAAAAAVVATPPPKRRVAAY
jgi:glucan 1,3-beta-glucosidase